MADKRDQRSSSRGSKVHGEKTRDVSVPQPRLSSSVAVTTAAIPGGGRRNFDVHEARARGPARCGDGRCCGTDAAPATEASKQGPRRRRESGGATGRKGREPRPWPGPERLLTKAETATHGHGSNRPRTRVCVYICTYYVSLESSCSYLRAQGSQDQRTRTRTRTGNTRH